jgi:hypothetical protein
MSYHVFFSFSQGLTQSIFAPSGTKASYLAHIAEVEEALHLKREQYEDNAPHWDSWHRDYGHLSDDKLCEIVENHNHWVRGVYADFTKWSKEPVTDGEEITLEDAQTFWHGLEILSVPPSRWSKNYYRARMEMCYEVMRGRESEGVSFDAKVLTPKQAAAVINLFSSFLDKHDLRLDVPNGHDYLASSYDGGYDWCEKCGPMHPDEIGSCRKRKCPLRDEYA